MTSKLFRSDRDGWWTLRDILNRDEEFHNTTGKLRGMKHNPDVRLPDTGRMCPADANKMHATHSLWGITYIIFSFATPIAYRDTHGNWTVPDAGYSTVTKSKHLSRVRPAVAELEKVSA